MNMTVRSQWLFGVLCVGAVVAGCTEDMAAVPGESARAIELVAGNNQQSVAGSELPEELVVRIMDSAGRSVPGSRVAWVATGGGVMNESTTWTDTMGYARARWTLGPAPGGQEAEVRVPTEANGGVAAQATFAATATSAQGQLTIAPAGRIILYTGTTQQLTVTARDGSGAVMPDAAVSLMSSNQGVATVTNSGLIMARAAGVVLITASAVCCSESTVEVSVRNPPAGVDFASDWSTATGSSSAALLDASNTTAWSTWRTAAGLPLLNVVSAAGLGFPSANALRVSIDGTQSSDIRAIDLWPAPAPGQSLFFRLYARFDIPNSYGNLGASSNHPIQPEPGSCPYNWAFNVGSFQDGTLDLRWTFSSSGAGFGLSRVLRKFQTYRWEWAFHRQQNGTYKADIRIFDTSGNLVADGRHFISQYNPDYSTPLSTKNPDLNISDACIRLLMIGSNGPSWPSMTNSFTYYGAAAVRLSNSQTDWIGAY
jgi:hypothetical protein